MMAWSLFKRFVAPWVSAVLLLTLVRYIDTTFLPPVAVFEVQKVRVESSAVFLSGRLYKPEYRASCKLASVVAVVNQQKLEVIYPTQTLTDATRPPGWTSFYDMKVPGQQVREITLTSRHSCYGSFAWDHSTTLATVKLETQP